MRLACSLLLISVGMHCWSSEWPKDADGITIYEGVDGVTFTSLSGVKEDIFDKYRDRVSLVNMDHGVILKIIKELMNNNSSFLNLKLVRLMELRMAHHHKYL